MWIRSSSFHTANPVVYKLELASVQGLYVGTGSAVARGVLTCLVVLPRRNHGQTDRAVLRFNLDADLSSVFHWNVKQLFVFVTAEYTTKTNVRWG